MSTRAEQLSANLAAVRSRIEAACSEVGRDPAEITLEVVTKFFPASDVRLLAAAGITDVAENRHQEAEAKAAECADLGLRWHFIGGLQSNKAAAVARYADVIESVDRRKLVGPLDRGAEQAGRDRDVLIQVSLDPPGADHRSGATKDSIPELADAIATTEHLRLRGVMAVAPLGEEPGPAFARLAEIHAELLAEHPEATWRSAGMSHDLEAAIRSGATHVRIGSAVLGSRPVVQ